MVTTDRMGGSATTMHTPNPADLWLNPSEVRMRLKVVIFLIEYRMGRDEFAKLLGS